MPPLAFLKGNSEADARLLAKEGSRHPDKANPTKVARACSCHQLQDVLCSPPRGSRGRCLREVPEAGKHLFKETSTMDGMGKGGGGSQSQGGGV